MIDIIFNTISGIITNLASLLQTPVAGLKGLSSVVTKAL